MDYACIKVVHLRKSDKRHNCGCKCGFCQRLNRFQERVYCSEFDCVALVAKNNEAVEAERLANPPFA